MWQLARMVYHICLSLLHSQYLQKQSLENQHELRITTLLTNVSAASIFCSVVYLNAFFPRITLLRLYMLSRLSSSSPTDLIGNQFIFPQVAFQKEQDLHLCRNTKTTTQPEMLSFWTVPSSFIVGNFESSLPLTFFFSSRILLYWGRMVRMTVETNQTEQWYS